MSILFSKKVAKRFPHSYFSAFSIKNRHQNDGFETTHPSISQIVQDSTTLTLDFSENLYIIHLEKRAHSSFPRAILMFVPLSTLNNTMWSVVQGSTQTQNYKKPLLTMKAAVTQPDRPNRLEMQNRAVC